LPDISSKKLKSFFLNQLKPFFLLKPTEDKPKKVPFGAHTFFPRVSVIVLFLENT